MPIHLSTSTPIGVNATYHVLTNITLYPMQKQITVTVQSYATSDADMQQMISRPYSFDYSVLGDGVNDPTQVEIYAYLLTLQDYAGGVIV